MNQPPAWAIRLGATAGTAGAFWVLIAPDARLPFIGLLVWGTAFLLGRLAEASYRVDSRSYARLIGAHAIGVPLGMLLALWYGQVAFGGALVLLLVGFGSAFWGAVAAREAVAKTPRS
jgi:membrane protein required for beta-lactamase induction